MTVMELVAKLQALPMELHDVDVYRESEEFGLTLIEDVRKIAAPAPPADGKPHRMVAVELA